MKTYITPALLLAALVVGGCATYADPYPRRGYEYREYRQYPAYPAVPAYPEERRHHYRDQDRDGVPDRYDRDIDGDGIRNKKDARPNDPRSRPGERDWDGDGVRNKYDDQPQNPYRR